jgi:O-antigen/teichoic acid export membrane protein
VPVKLQKSEFVRNVITLVSGSFIAQLIPFAAEPILSRIYTPTEFGVFELFSSIIMIFGSVATARYEMAIILPKLENKAVNLLGLSLLITFMFSIAVLGVLLFTRGLIINLMAGNELSRYLFFIPIGILLLGINRSFLYWSLRNKYLNNISYSRITESSGKAGSSILLGFMRFSSFGLIFGQLTGLILSGIVLIYKFVRADYIKSRFLSFKNIGNQAKKHIDFPKINVPLTLTEMFQVSGLIFMFSFFFDTHTLGEISKSIRILLIPVILISTTIAQVFYQKASQEYNRGIDISKSLNNIVKTLFLWSLPALFLFMIISPWLFGFVLGANWINAGLYARYLAVWIFIKFVTGPVGVIPMIINKQKEYFLLNLLGNFLLIAAVIIPGVLNVRTGYLLMILCSTQVLFLVFLYFKTLSLYRNNPRTA